MISFQTMSLITQAYLLNHSLHSGSILYYIQDPV